MAKVKQQKVTMEGQLERALVPEDEQPYEVPGNWVWTKLDKILRQLTDGSHFSPKTIEDGVPYITVKDLSNGLIDFVNCKMISKEDYEALKKNNCQPHEDDILFSKDGTVGKTALVNFNKEFVVLSSLAILRPNKALIVPRYLEQVLNSPQVLYQAINSKTGTAIKRIVLKSLCNLLIPLPPLAEQHRIIDRIESLFAKLDQAKELAQNTLDTFETRKAAILHKAFTGELTAKWREKNGVGMESWEKCYWSDLANTVKDKFDPALGTSNLPYIGLEHIAKGNGIIAIGKAEDVKSLKTVFKSGDILYGKLRPYLNKHDIASFDGMCSTDILAFRTNNETTAKYLNYLMDTTPFINYAVSNSKGINLPRVSEKEITKYIVNIPSLPEQQEIVRILDSLFEKEQKAKELCDVIDKIDLMKKAVLARAFRGELGTNDPSEESAVELLGQPSI